MIWQKDLVHLDCWIKLGDQSNLGRISREVLVNYYCCIQCRHSYILDLVPSQFSPKLLLPQRFRFLPWTSRKQEHTKDIFKIWGDVKLWGYQSQQCCHCHVRYFIIKTISQRNNLKKKWIGKEMLKIGRSHNEIN